MSPVKDEGSSRRKGKEVTPDDPFAKIVGEETYLSELDCSEEEEGGRDPNSECHPFIDPRYDAHIHFPVVPGDYSPPPLSRVWLSICRYDTDVSWPLWLPPFLILIYAKGYRSPCPSSSNLGPVLPWVGRSGWTRSCPTWVSWRRYSRPMC